jgi:alpha-mannosidase
MLDDYLEIRPGNRDRLAAPIRDGRILIGPWFTMPDLFCVVDEAIVRNLLLGRRIAGEWDVEPMPREGRVRVADSELRLRPRANQVGQ